MLFYIKGSLLNFEDNDILEKSNLKRYPPVGSSQENITKNLSPSPLRNRSPTKMRLETSEERGKVI
jgi:hypothetical protein